MDKAEREYGDAVVSTQSEAVNGRSRSPFEQLTKRLADEGKLVEAGWVAMRLNAIPLDAATFVVVPPARGG
jgi:hypothetical protein